MKGVPKYGIPMHTIRYWQEQAWDLWRYNGIIAGVRALSSDLSCASARDIGHAVIGLSYVASRWNYTDPNPEAAHSVAEYLKSVLDTQVEG